MFIQIETNRLALLLLWSITGSILLSFSSISGAQVNNNITLPGNSSQNLQTQITNGSGTSTTITGGTRAGTNLFHSFQSFSIGDKALAQFHNDGSSTTNIFARVVGGEQSVINGTLQTTGYSNSQFNFGNANLWFMNPSGIMFGSHAQLNVGGSATFTTANTLNFSNEGQFTMNSSVKDVGILSIASVVAFGFMGKEGTTPGPITITESNLSVPGPALAFVGGNILIAGGNLSAPNGVVRVTSVGPLQPAYEGDSWTFVDLNQETGAHSYSNYCYPCESSPSLAGTITLGQGPSGVDAVINARAAIQLNGVTYNGTNGTGYIGTDLTSGKPPVIIIQDGSLQVANLPSTQLIVSSPAVTSLSPATTLDVGGNGPLTVTLNHAFTRQVDIQVNSDNANVASVTPAAVTVPAGSNSASVTPGVHGVAPGTTSVKASAGTSAPAGALVQVTFPSSSLAPTPSALTEGDGGTVSITLGRPLSVPVTVTFGASNSSVLSLPSNQVTIPAGQTSSASVPFSTLQSGSATITASLQVGNQQVASTPPSSPIQVNPIPLQSFGPATPLIEGNNETLSVVLGKPAPHPITVTFTSSNPDAIPAPTPITIGQNQSTGPVIVLGQHPGTATITASYAGGNVTAPVVVNPPPITTFAPNLTVSSNTTGNVTITLAAPSSRDVRVALDSSNTGVARPNPFVIIPAGQKSVTTPIRGEAVGIATITASEGNSTASANVQVLDTSLSNSAAASNSVAAGKAPTTPLPSTYANQLIMASDRCVGSKTGEFSSFVQRGRDAAPPQPGGMLASPLGVQTGTPKISGLSLLPASAVRRGQGTLNLAPGVAAFLQLDKGC